jgi:flavin-binding protein dodecin
MDATERVPQIRNARTGAVTGRNAVFTSLRRFQTRGHQGRGPGRYARPAQTTTHEEDAVAEHADPTYRLSEIVGTSGESIHQAIRNGVARASETVRNIHWFGVEEIRGTVVDGEVGVFQVTMKIGFMVED